MPDPECPMGPDITRLSQSIELLVERMDSLIQLNRDIIRWLLVVVCIIALGRGALDVGNELLTKAASVSNEVIRR